MKKRYIVLLIIFIIFISIGIFILYLINYIPHKMYTSEHFNIEVYKSEFDKDKDGIDDQTDFLMGVRSYVAKSPKYKSKYYGSGYPNDEYGVCTDVVAFGLLASGYDIMELLNDDVKNNRDEYNITTIDKKIDFRRVNNLNTYLKRNAISLTTDIDKIDLWSGGDIVVFTKHIAVVSNMRNRKGIPFIIHHANNHQSSYEEDKLELYKDDIVGHYRIS